MFAPGARRRRGSGDRAPAAGPLAVHLARHGRIGVRRRDRDRAGRRDRSALDAVRARRRLARADRARPRRRRRRSSSRAASSRSPDVADAPRSRAARPRAPSRRRRRRARRRAGCARRRRACRDRPPPIATARPGGRPRPDSRQVAPPSCETSSGGRASTTATTVEPAAAAATHPRQVERAARARGSNGSSRQHLLRVEVDREGSGGGGDERDHSRPASTDADDRRRAPRGGGRRRARSSAPRRRRSQNASPAPVGSAPSANAGTSLGAARPRRRRAARAVGDEHLGHRERRRVAEHLGLLVAQLQHPHVAQHAPDRSPRRAGARPCARARTRPWPSKESRRPRASAARVSAGKSRAGERRDVHPPHRLGQHRHVVGQPRCRRAASISHLAVLAVVARCAKLAVAVPGTYSHRRPERDERRQQLVAVGVGAACVDARLGPQVLERSGGVERGAADPRRLPREEVAREVSEQRDHALASMGLRATSRARAARPNAASEARQRRAAPRQRVRIGVLDEPRPPRRPVRVEPLVDAEAGEPGEQELGAPGGGTEDVARARSGGRRAASRRAARRRAVRRRSRTGTGTAGSCAGRSAAPRRWRRPRSPRRGAAAARPAAGSGVETAPE